MEEYGSAGLRTLCLSYAELDPAFYEEWQHKFIEAKTSMEKREEKLAAVGELIEKDLQLLGWVCFYLVKLVEKDLQLLGWVRFQ
jgi:phospholipid-transporting ATPase